MADTNGNGNGSDYSLKTLGEDGAIPETRMSDAAQCQDYARRLRTNDSRRSFKRSKVDGLVAGFPPYKMAKMRDSGLSQNCNANFNTASSYMENGAGAFYDLFSEAPGYVGIITNATGTDEQREDWSREMSAEADLTFSEDKLLDYEMQRSQWEMVLHGCGPLFFEDAFKVFPCSIACGDVMVSERTKSDIEYFDSVVIDRDYYPPQIFEFIQNARAAAQTGWRVNYTRRCIANAMNITEQRGLAYDWEYYEQQLKANSLEYIDETKVVQVSFVLWKEFDGTISQAIVERESTSAGAVGDNLAPENSEAVQYLFFHRGRYQNFGQAMQAMYFDRGNGGFHHSVTGLGVKMYSAMENENRALCRLFDGIFAPKVLFKPTTTEATQKMQLAHLSDYGVMPAGWEAQQMPINGFINEGLAMYRASSDLMRSNLSNYRQQVEPQKPGNPETKFGRQLDASQAGSLSKTTFNRYYRQLDFLYAEIVRRLCNINSTDPRAKAYQKRCMDKGVPEECFGRIKSVQAVRVVGGGGSAFMRKSVIAELGPVEQRFPEDGQRAWLDDLVAATCGQNAVSRYNPKKRQSKLGDDQSALAMLQIAGMKVGTNPVVASSQNALKFAGMFLSACVQAVQSIKQGADPKQVIAFVDIAGPACMAHLKRIANDPLRHQAVEAIQKQLKQLTGIVDKLKKQMQEDGKQQKAQQQKTQAAMSDQQIKAQKVQGDLALKAKKQQATLGMQFQKHRQSLAIHDATAASNIHRQNRLAAFQE